ncbi:MAG: hypothetical protein JJ953_04545 [Gracilimonas sp.]|uniref:hypothetical protein n=1 Tax=Gracilimonas sp. TaxID=1974203 RepID=UPI001B0DB889|nr:hypothetical protein [Gracilimonas sp.]MBO6585350.1 hypothetical protein [Gracilimonas sp.]MBO6616346.1 hypothetical protein [Gracilimonas sp.]
MRNFLRNLFQREKEPDIPAPEPNYTEIINKIKQTEESQDIQPGRKIHAFDYDLFELRLDRDITNQYRITVFRGSERVYSFTVFVTKQELQKLDKAYRDVISFLKENPSVAHLPDNDLLKGFYFGNS